MQIPTLMRSSEQSKSIAYCIGLKHLVQTQKDPPDRADLSA